MPWWISNETLYNAILAVQRKQSEHDKTLARLLKRLDEIETRQSLTLKEIVALRFSLQQLRVWLLTPNPLGFRLLGESPMSKIQFGITLPEKPAKPEDWAEIASGLLSVQIAAAEPLSFKTTKDTQESTSRLFVDPSLIGPQDVSVSVSFRYVDDAGNPSLNHVTLAFPLIDTVPPVDPSALGAVLLAELPDDPVVPPVDPPVEAASRR